MATQLRLVDTDSSAEINPWDDLDEATRRRGLRGVAHARAALRDANRRAALRDAKARSTRDAEIARRVATRHLEPAPVVHLSEASRATGTPSHPDDHAA